MLLRAVMISLALHLALCALLQGVPSVNRLNPPPPLP